MDSDDFIAKIGNPFRPPQAVPDPVAQMHAREMGYLFENMEKISIQEMRRKAEEQRREAEELRMITG